MSTPRQCDEGDGTWVDWVYMNPNRLRALVQEATSKLESYQVVDVEVQTRFGDDAGTAELQKNASCRRAAAALRGWQGYHYFNEDFEVDQGGLLSVQIVGFSLSSCDIQSNSSSLRSMLSPSGQTPDPNFVTISQAASDRSLFQAISRIEEAYLLPMSDTCLLTRLGRRYTRCNLQVMQTWLSRYAMGYGTLCYGLPKRMCAEYDFDHLLRVFIRRVLCLSNGAYASGPLRHHFDVVLTGEYAVQKCLSDNIPSNDIDFFVRCRSMVPKIIGLYHEICMLPLRLRLTHVVTTAGSFHRAMLPVNESHTVTARDPQYICEHVQSILDEFLDDRPALSTDMAELLAKTVDCLPSTYSPRPYGILGSWSVHPTYSEEYIPFTLLTLNITLVSCPASVGEPMLSSQQDTRSLMDSSFCHFLWQGFDFKHCCVALTVRNDLHYEFHAAMNTFAVLSQKKLVLLPASFQDSVGNLAIHAQLMRIAQYAHRGFTW